MKKIKCFGIVAFKKKNEVYDTIEKIINWALSKNISIILHPILKEKFKNFVSVDENDFIQKSDVIASIGGDGTFLSVAHLCHFSKKPIVGVNIGGLGFLTDISKDSIEESFSKILEGSYRIIKRMVFRVELKRKNTIFKSFLALNDIFINRINTPKLTSISAWYGEDYITDFYADGIIVATPTGSTAYSLSAGGPIVEPSLKAFILTPICPHSLTERSLVLSSEKEIKLKINEKNPDLLLSVDGIESVHLKYEDEVIVSYNSKESDVIHLVEHSYFNILSHKLDWGKGHKYRREKNDS